MNILFVGVFSGDSTNVGQWLELERISSNFVDTFDYRRVSKLEGSDVMHKKLENLAENNYDLIILSKCNQLNVKSIQPFRKRGTRVLLWYMDPMHNFNDELRQKILISDYVACALARPYHEAIKLNPRTSFVPEGFYKKDYYPVRVNGQDINVSFIGSLYGHRKEYINFDTRISVFNNVFKKDHNNIVARSKINLNFTSGGTSDRIYKILAAGGFLLTQPWPEMEKLFNPGKDFDLFRNKEEMKDKIYYYLKNKRDRDIIASNGIKSVQKYTYSNWAKEILEIVR